MTWGCPSVQLKKNINSKTEYWFRANWSHKCFKWIGISRPRSSIWRAWDEAKFSQVKEITLQDRALRVMALRSQPPNTCVSMENFRISGAPQRQGRTFQIFRISTYFWSARSQFSSSNDVLKILGTSVSNLKRIWTFIKKLTFSVVAKLQNGQRFESSRATSQWPEAVILSNSSKYKF